MITHKDNGDNELTLKYIIETLIETIKYTTSTRIWYEIHQ